MPVSPTSMDAGTFVPTTNVWDVSDIYSTDVNSPEFKELLVRLYQNINNITLALNVKDTGLYLTTPIVNGQVFFPNPALNSNTQANPTLRQDYRLLVICGTLPNAGTKAIPHGLTFNSSTSATRIYGAATDPVNMDYIPLPFASPILANNIQLSIDATDVLITTAANFSLYTISYVIIEYITT